MQLQFLNATENRLKTHTEPRPYFNESMQQSELRIQMCNNVICDLINMMHYLLIDFGSDTKRELILVSIGRVDPYFPGSYQSVCKEI